MTIEKISSAQVGEMMKLAGETLNRVSAELDTYKAKVAHYEKRERVEKIAAAMQEKGLDPETSLSEKIANLMKRDNLDTFEAAVEMSAPQMKTASVHDEAPVSVEGHGEGERAASTFAQNLATLD